MNPTKQIKQGLKRVLPDWARLYLKDIASYLDSDLRKYNPLIYKKFDQQKSGNNANILILGLRTYRHYDLAVFEKVLSDVLGHNGAQVTNVLCGNVLDSCDADSEEEKHQKFICKMCKHERNNFKMLYKNNYIFFRDFLSLTSENIIRKMILNLSHEELLRFNYLDVNVSTHAIESTQRYYRKNILNLKDDHTIEILRDKLMQGTLCVEVAKNIMQMLKPTHFITLHGVYVSWGPMAEYFRNNGVKVCSYVKSADIMGTFIFYKEALNKNIFEKDSWELFACKELSDEQKKQLNKLMLSKKNGGTLAYKLYSQAFKDNSSHIDISEKLNNPYKTKYVLYPNLLWDADLETGGSFIFKDVKDWLVETIKYFKMKKNSYLFVKPHPAERMESDYTKEGVEYAVRSLLKDEIPPNVFFMPDDYRVTAFDLMENGVIGITYNGTVGIEHAYFKKPIIVAGNIHYADAGIVPKVSSRDEYFNFIENPELLINYANDNWGIIEKFCHYHYFMTMIDIPFYRKDRWLGHCINWDILKNYQSFVEKDVTMNKLATDIIRWKPFLNVDIAHPIEHKEHNNFR